MTDGDRFAKDRTELRSGASDDGPQAARFAPGERIADRFRIVSRLGGGGMGEVFRAEDLRLGQEVALKFLPAGIADDPLLRERLVSEVRIGRQVSHPNVCRLYDLLDADGQSFVAMELIDGEDLASLLRRIGRLSVDKGLALGREIAAGLAAAHARGIVHRDLKPANVMIDGAGVARITDFGLAIAGTGPRELAGTPAYMAPEQLAGEPATVRSDLYAFGLILFEILTGRRVFEGETIADLRKVRRDALPYLRAFVPEADPEIERAILSCLAESPQARPASSAEVAAMLGIAPREHQSATDRSTPKRTVSSGRARQTALAVLPFESLAGASGDDDFAIGLAEEIIGDLGKIRSLRVIARGSVMRFKGAQEVGLVARELGVRYVLTGTIRKAGENLRITTSLVDGEDESLVWSEKFRGSMQDIFEIQETIARSIASQLKVHLSADESATLAQHAAQDAHAYEIYLKARAQILRWDPAALELAISSLQGGLARFPDDVLLKACLATAYWQRVNAGADSDPANLAEAERLAGEIFAADPQSHHGKRILGLVALARGNGREAIVRLREVLAADPNDTDALLWLGILYSFSGLPDLGAPLARRLMELDPLGPDAMIPQVVVSWMSGDYERAVEGLREARLRAPESQVGLGGLWLVLAEAGRMREADMVAELVPPEGGSFLMELVGFVASAAAGDRARALEHFQRVESAAREDIQYPLHIAEGFALLGEPNTAIDWLEHGVGRGFLAWEFLERHDVLLASLREMPRFRELIARTRRGNEELRATLAAQS